MNEYISLYSSYMYSYPHKTAYRIFENPVPLSPWLDLLSGREASLYFHIPFCRTKCGYCNLFSQQSCDTHRVDDYLTALDRQAAQLSPLTENLQFTSFAIGGGTPLLLTEPQLERLFGIAQRFRVSPSRVFTSVETSPDYASEPVLQMLRAQGVERLSIGVQSFNEAELKQLKRRIHPDKIHEALQQIRSVGFPQFNVDLIYGIKGQTEDSFVHSLSEALSYHPHELFIYPLYVRPGTSIRAKSADDEALHLYHTGRSMLLEAGFMQTSMRRFVRRSTVEQEFSCGDEVMISCGAGGRSYLGDLHYSTLYAVSQLGIRRVIDHYMATEDFGVATNGILLSEDEHRCRFLIKNLMYYKGINKAEYEQRFQQPFPYEDFHIFAGLGWVEEVNGYVRLTATGMAYSDYIGQFLISPAVRNLMRMYLYPEFV